MMCCMQWGCASDYFQAFNCPSSQLLKIPFTLYLKCTPVVLIWNFLMLDLARFYYCSKLCVWLTHIRGFLSGVIRLQVSSFVNWLIFSWRHKWSWNPYIQSRDHCCLEEHTLFEVLGFHYPSGSVGGIKMLDSFEFSSCSGTARSGS